MDPAAPAPFSRRILPLLLVAAVFLAFSPALKAGWVNWDDTTNFHSNPHYRGLGPTQLAWMWTNITGHYMPLTWMTLGLDYELWEMDPAGYHFTSVCFHAANAVLAFFFLKILLGHVRIPDRSEAVRTWTAAAGALLYALHPLRVESVAWITERRDVVAGFFVLLCLLAYVKARSTEGPLSTRWLILSVAAFGASLLSKTIGMTLPLALLALDAWPLRRFSRGPDGRVPWRRPLLEKLPFFALMLFGIAITAYGQQTVGAIHVREGMVRLHNALAQPPLKMAFYFLKTFIPTSLSPLYPYRLPESLFGTVHLLSALALAALGTVLVLARRRAPEWVFGAVVFLLLLGPVIGPLQAGPHFAADRYTYVAALAWSVAAGVFLLRCPPRLASGLALAAVALLAVLTYRQCGIWNDSEALWSRAIAVDDSSELPFMNRGAHRNFLRRFPEAIADFTEAHRRAPHLGKPLGHRSISRLQLGQVDAAWEDAVKATSLSPQETRGWFARGEVNSARQRFKEAIEDYTRAIQIDPVHVESYLGRAIAKGAMGDFQGAYEDCSIILVLHPYYVEAWANRAVARGEAGDLDGAIQDYTQAIRLNPKLPEAWGGRAKVQMLRRAWMGAASDFEQALRVAPPHWPHRKDAEAGLAEARRQARAR